MGTLSRIKLNGKIAILGSGISGLTYAYFVSKIRPDLNITIFEKSDRVGGWIQTTELVNDANNEIIRLDKGPRSLRGVSEGTLVILDILNQLGHRDQIKVVSANSKANRKFLLNSNYELVPIPHDFKSHIKAIKMGLLSGIPLKVISEPFRKLKRNYDDESIELFFERRFNSTVVTDKILSGLMHGIYAGDVSKLSIKLFSRLQTFENQGSIILSMIKQLYANLTNKEPKQLPQILKSYEHEISPYSDLSKLASDLKGFPMVVFKDSLTIFPRILADYLKTNDKIKFIMNSSISQVDLDGKLVNDGKTLEFDHIRSTINVKSLGQLIKSNDAKNLVDEFNKIEYVSIFMANIYSKLNIIPSDANGFGFLVPKASNNKEFLLGTIFDSSIASYSTSLKSTTLPQKADYDKMTLMFGGHYFKPSTPSTNLSLKAVKNILLKVFDINDEKYNFVIRDEQHSTSNSVDLNQHDILISYNLHKDCIPQPNVGYEEIKHTVLKELQSTKLSLGGMCFGKGVGVPDCVINSLQDALKYKST